MLKYVKSDFKRWQKRGYICILIPQFHSTLLYHLSHFFYRQHIPLVPHILSYINFILYGVEISSSLDIGEGLYLAHTFGVILGAKSIGKNVYINSGVVCGGKDDNLEHRPTIGDDVFIGTGAKILGDVKIGNGAIIGANAVVIDDVPDNSTAVGVPAKIKIRKNE